MVECDALVKWIFTTIHIYLKMTKAIGVFPVPPRIIYYKNLKCHPERITYLYNRKMTISWVMLLRLAINRKMESWPPDTRHGKEVKLFGVLWQDRQEEIILTYTNAQQL